MQQDVFGDWSHAWGVDTVTELLRLTPVDRTAENGWTPAELTEIPGVVTSAPSGEEAQELLVDALP